MNSEYVTGLRVRQHQADLVREAREHGLAVASLPCRPDRAGPRLTAGWWRRRALPNCQPEVAGA